MTTFSSARQPKAPGVRAQATPMTVASARDA